MAQSYRILVAVLAASLPAAASADGPAEKALADARAASVLVEVPGGAGSGVMVKNGDHTFVWTDAHVLEPLQQVRVVADPASGLPKVEVAYQDCWVTNEVIKDGRKVGEDSRLARVVRYDTHDDIGLLLVVEKGWGRGSVRFATGEPKVGAAVWHVGCFRGRKGMGSVSDGVVAAVGRLRGAFKASDTDRPVVSDQYSLTATQGSSGGGVFAKDGGECLGLIDEFLDAHPVLGFSHGALCVTPAPTDSGVRRSDEGRVGRRPDDQGPRGPGTGDDDPHPAAQGLPAGQAGRRAGTQAG
jgi:hypothetical protein